MEMAFRFVLIFAAALSLSAFPVEHRHLHGRCIGDLQIDTAGVSFGTAGGLAAGDPKHAGHWKLEDIRELKLAPDHVYVLTYHRGYDFRGEVPAQKLYAALRNAMDRRLVLEAAEPPRPALYSVPVKHRGGGEGVLAFGDDALVYTSDARDESRTWRYRDIDNIATSGPFQLTLTTFERARAHYHDRKDFNFELKQPITEAQYNRLWLLVEKKNGRIP
jgi:hypothetical protein